MNLDIKIIADDEAIKLISSDEFVEQWRALAKNDKKFTVIQESPFVITWYHLYINKFRPILVLGYDSDGILVGLMPLAVSRADGSMTHAGGRQAEYHGWLSLENYETIFPVRALIAIKSTYNSRRWQWRCLPPGSETKWALSSQLKDNQIFVRFEEADLPILDLSDDQKIKKIKKNKAAKLNKYAKREGFHIERIKSKEKARQVFDILAEHCDFRQMAIHQTTPFASDENKKPFYIERADLPEANHFTVLWAEGNPVAFHFGACDSETVILGLASYNPVEEKNSPGTIMMIKLIELLKEEGFKRIDLTPGGDAYKERYSTHHQKIFTPVIYFSKRDKVIADLKHQVSKLAKTLLFRLGGSPEGAVRTMMVLTGSIKQVLKAGLGRGLKIILNKFHTKRTLILYRHAMNGSFNSEAAAANNDVALNSHADLLLYDDSNAGLTRSELFTNALKHFALEDILYTKVVDNTLAQYGWIGKLRVNCDLAAFEQDLGLSGESYILHDFYTDPRSDHKVVFSQALRDMLMVCEGKGAKEVFIGVWKERESDRALLEDVGFHVYRTLSMGKTLGWRHRTTVGIP